MHVFSDPLIRMLTNFVRRVGIDVIAASSVAPTQFPGLDIQSGAVLVDETRIIHPGDILHEAGHLAVTHPARRNAPRLDPTGGEELSTLAWAYAAAVHLGIDPAIVFYPGSYQNFAGAVIEHFPQGRTMGVPLLQAWGMALEPQSAAARRVRPFPHMLRWLR